MNLSRLCDLKGNQRGKVVSIQAKTEQDLHGLLAAGVMQNSPVSVIYSDAKHVLFFSEGRELAVDHDIASQIYVELESIM